MTGRIGQFDSSSHASKEQNSEWAQDSGSPAPECRYSHSNADWLTAVQCTPCSYRSTFVPSSIRRGSAIGNGSYGRFSTFKKADSGP
jgi:hypothetical protein